jgi:hypothetical protein
MEAEGTSETSVDSSEHEAPHCATSFILLLLNPPQAQIISLNLSLKRNQSLLVSEYKKETKFNTHTQPLS